MAQIKIYSPNAAYKGKVGAVEFDKGIAVVEDGAAELGYFKRRGYGIGSPVENPVLPYDKMEPTRDGEIVDARSYGEQHWAGRPLRDAAVDPEPTDFLPPTNAGEANPHGPSVVAPEIHASGPAGIRSGEVHVDDTKRQEKAETALATEVLIEGATAEDRAVAFDPNKNMGPLGLSDPGSADMGVAAAADASPAASVTTPVTKPASRPRTAKPRTSKPRTAKPKETSA